MLNWKDIREWCEAALKCFDSNADIIIQTVISHDELGACLMQNSRPIAHASKALTVCEKSYAQIEKSY